MTIRVLMAFGASVFAACAACAALLTFGTIKGLHDDEKAMRAYASSMAELIKRKIEEK